MDVRQNFSRIVIPFLALCAVNSASADLIGVDYVASSGDSWITLDTQTGMEWLDVNLTGGQTFDEERTGEWIERGFRYATQQELLQLFVDAGIPDDGFDTSNTQPSQALMLAMLLGPTLAVGDRVSVAGFVGTDFFGNDISFESHPLGVSFAALLGKVDYLGMFGYGEAHFTGGHPASDEADDYYGSFLVRGGPPATPVPTPASTVLLAFGVLLMHRQRRI